MMAFPRIFIGCPPCFGVFFRLAPRDAMAETMGWSCPAGRAFFLLRQKEAKMRLMGCRP